MHIKVRSCDVKQDAFSDHFIVFIDNIYKYIYIYIYMYNIVNTRRVCLSKMDACSI